MVNTLETTNLKNHKNPIIPKISRATANLVETPMKNWHKSPSKVRISRIFANPRIFLKFNNHLKDLNLANPVNWFTCVYPLVWMICIEMVIYNIEKWHRNRGQCDIHDERCTHYIFDKKWPNPFTCCVCLHQNRKWVFTFI